MRTLVDSTARLDAVESLVRLRDGVPVVDSLKIARTFGRSHKHVLRTLDSLIADQTITEPNFGPSEYRDASGKACRLIELDEHGALVTMPFIGGRKSCLGQKQLVAEFLAMRETLRAMASDTQKHAAPAPTLKSPIGDLALAESIGRLLNVSPSGRVALLRHVAKNHSLDETLLPAYVVDAPSDAMPGSSEATAPISVLLKEAGVGLSAVRFNRLLEYAGLMEKRTRRTTQKRFGGGVKSFWLVTPEGLRFGKNLIDTRAPRETVPHWYVGRFAELRTHLRPIFRRMQAEEAL
ncbi:Rha family transcriptional regulator [Paraburkholderia sp. BL17N1]|uniref:Rha family transcriptional regulator n=1 Tax=Paraburkholderia sp. BL17N1 TaxID=1938798 RepID=UPI000F2803A1|nr:Rha family transcriptional regulator [Paraburkholderia sp. BL17N1]RKR44569.1 Rha family phage regulatory protein [Paraburkholderia sp. BL17N1]